jgi:hypothetical protein
VRARDPWGRDPVTRMRPCPAQVWVAMEDGSTRRMELCPTHWAEGGVKAAGVAVEAGAWVVRLLL